MKPMDHLTSVNDDGDARLPSNFDLLTELIRRACAEHSPQRDGRVTMAQAMADLFERGDVDRPEIQP